MAKAEKTPHPNRKRKDRDVIARDASRCRASYRRGFERPDRPGRRQRLAAKTIRGLLEDQRKLILLNLADVDYIDSSGIGELVSGYTAVKNQSGELKLLHLTKKSAIFFRSPSCTRYLMCLRTRTPRFEVLFDSTRPVLTGTTSEYSFSSLDSRDYGTISLMMPLADTVWIVDQAKTLGFDLCGVVRAEQFPELQRMPEWLARGYAGEMKYLADPAMRSANCHAGDPERHRGLAQLQHRAASLSTDPCRTAKMASRKGGFPLCLGRRLSRCVTGETGRAHGIPARTLYRSIRGACIRGHGTGPGASAREYAGLGWLGKTRCC